MVKNTLLPQQTEGIQRHCTLMPSPRLTSGPNCFASNAPWWTFTLLISSVRHSISEGVHVFLGEIE